MIQRIKCLVEKLNIASDAYYNTGNPTMTDEEFDLMLEELRTLEHATRFIMSNSPTQNVGAEVKTSLSKVKHTRPMLSLDKCHSAKELINFAEDDECYMSVKCDGLTTRLIYENGLLVGAETRGDGEHGQDILFHVKEYTNVPIQISVTHRFVIDGESVIFYSDFEQINNNLPENERFANPRNLASGTLANLDANITKKRKMRFVAWRIIEGDEQDDHFWRLKHAEQLGFAVAPMLTYVNKVDKNNIETMLHSLRRQANQMELPMDGIVMAKNSDIKSESMGRTSKFFRHSIAYKFEDDKYPTRLKYIDWTIGKSSQLTPTAVFENIEIDGTDVSRASLHNVSIIKNLGLTNGCTVNVFKANQIIPQIDSCENDGNGEIEIPSTCPICGGATIINKDNESEVLICTNPKCSGKLLAKFVHFVSRKCMNIDGLAESILEKLISLGYINDFKSIYHLSDHHKELVKLDGFGQKSVEKLLLAIEKSRNVKLENFIAALGIDGIGLSASKTISERFNGDIDAVLDAYDQGFDWTELSDFGDIMAKNLNDFFEVNIANVYNLAGEMHFTLPEVQTDNSLNGLKFCITGSFSQPRDNLKSQLESRGAKFVSSVSKNLDVLFAGDKAGSKLTKAQQLGVKVANEDELMKLLSE